MQALLTAGPTPSSGSAPSRRCRARPEEYTPPGGQSRPQGGLGGYSTCIDFLQLRHRAYLAGGGPGEPLRRRGFPAIEPADADADFRRRLAPGAGAVAGPGAAARKDAVLFRSWPRAEEGPQR